jgi:tetratricopeptide (TPR) repeat protein
MPDADKSTETAAFLKGVAKASPTPTPAAVDLVGQMLEQYRIGDVLGRGGMGVVYRAEDTRLGRTVAVKVLPEARADDEERRRRFLREARSAASVTHPNIVTVHEVGEHEGRIFLVMELVAGETLSARIARGRLALPEAMRIARGIARGVARAHANGVIHRDLKPSNVMVDADGEPKVLDFGLAKSRGRDDAASTHATSEGLVLGTPQYMSPEQARGEAVDVRTDVFSLGLIVYEMLAGKPPFAAASTSDVIAAILRDRHEPLGKIAPDLPATIDAIVDRCLAKAPLERYANAGELLAALEGSSEATLAQTRLRSRGRGRRIAGVLLGAAALGGVVAFIALRATSADDPSTKTQPRRAIAITDHPPPKTASREAAAEYAAAIQALHDGTDAIGLDRLARAIKLDANFAAAHLRLLLYGPDADGAQHYAAASQNREALSELDRDLLAVFDPLVLRSPPDIGEAVRRVRGVVAKHPDDAEVALGAAQVITASGDQAAGLRELDRALALDHTFALALTVRATIETANGDWDASLATAGRCLAVSPVAASCARVRAEIFAARGQCDALEREAKLSLASEPEGAMAHLYAANMLSMRRAPVEAVRDALLRALPFVSGNPGIEQQYEGRLAVYVADFGAAATRLREADRLARAKNPSLLINAAMAVSILEEQGERAQAADLADEVLRHLPSSAEFDPEAASLALAEVHLAGKITPAEYRHRRDAWLAATHATLGDNTEDWVYFHARTAATAEDAREAIGALPKGARFDRRLNLLSTYTLLQEPVGRTYLLAGDLENAVVHLRAAAGACRTLQNQLTWVRAHAELGEALAAKGDTKGACAAYAVVLDYWGNAKPRSITADKARDNAKRLGCEQSGSK